MRLLPHLLFRSPDDPPAGGGSPKGTPVDETVKALEAATAARLAAEAKVAEMVKAQADRETAEALKRGEHETLYKTEKQRADDLAAKLKAHEERETARVADLDKANKARVKEIPEARRGLVPDGLDPVALDAYLTRNLATLKGDEPAAGTRSTGGTDHGMTDDTVRAKHPDIAAEADARGMTPTAWFNILLKAGRKVGATA